MTFSVYIITHVVSLKAYVGLTGMTIERRFQGHCTSARKGVGWMLHAAMRKHGIDMFSVDLLETVETRAEAVEREKHYIVEFNTRAPAGYNLTDGGDGALGYRHTEEFKAKLSERLTGQKLPPEQVEAMRRRMLGWVPSEATRKIMAAAQTGRTHGVDTIEKMSVSAKRRWVTNPNVLTPERQEQLRNYAVGRVPTQSHRDAISKALTGIKRSPESIARMSVAAQKRADRQRASGQLTAPPSQKGIPRSKATKLRMVEAWKKRRKKENVVKEACLASDLC